MTLPTAPIRCQGRKTYCGPYALATVTGKTGDEVYAAFRRCRRARGNRRKRVGGVSHGELERMMRYFGIRAKAQNLRKARTSLLKCWDWLKPNRLYIVALSTHYVTIETAGRKVIDTFSLDWVPVAEHPWRLSRLEAVWEIRRVANPTEN